MVLAPKLEPNWHQNALKTDPTTNQKNDHILDRLRSDFGSILGSNLAPDWGNQRLLCRLMLALVGSKIDSAWSIVLEAIFGWMLDTFFTVLGHMLRLPKYVEILKT